MILSFFHTGNHRQMQKKACNLHHASIQVTLKLSERKTKILKINATTDGSFTKKGAGDWGKLKSFPCLGSVKEKQGETDGTDKARTAFDMLKKVWNSKEIDASTKHYLKHWASIVDEAWKSVSGDLHVPVIEINLNNITVYQN